VDRSQKTAPGTIGCSKLIKLLILEHVIFKYLFSVRVSMKKIVLFSLLSFNIAHAVIVTVPNKASIWAALKWASWNDRPNPINNFLEGSALDDLGGKRGEAVEIAQEIKNAMKASYEKAGIGFLFESQFPRFITAFISSREALQELKDKKIINEIELGAQKD